MNSQTIKINLNYKESIDASTLSEGQKKERKFCRNEQYGLSKDLADLPAKFVLVIMCDFEVFGFEKDFLVPNEKRKKEYTWGGTVPKEGKLTYVKLSKPEAKWSFNLSEIVRNINNKNILNIMLSVPTSFVGGNNEIIKFNYSSEQSDIIKINKSQKAYEINYVNTDSPIGGFNVEGEFINRCKTEWVVDVTDEQIDKEIPNDFKINKDKYKKKACEMIKEYDKENKKNIFLDFPDPVKIGKWINKHIKYDLTYAGKNDLTAFQILENGAGTSFHFTLLFNALMYSLGYTKIILVSGFKVEKNDCFDFSNRHLWSLIKIKEKWYPFDATCGIFTGKFPVCHIFQNYFYKGSTIGGTDSVCFDGNKIKGRYLDIY